MILGNAIARHNEPYDRLAKECVKRWLLIVGVLSGGTAEGHATTTCLVIGRSAHVQQGLQDSSSAPQPPRSLWPPRGVEFTNCDAPVSDDGVGMSPPPKDDYRDTGFGQRLLRSMVAQLEGSLQFEHGGTGTVAVIRFRA
jgi:two-component sensor histidine kinase